MRASPERLRSGGRPAGGSRSAAAPTSTGSIGNTVTLFRRLRLYALVDWKHGNRLDNSIDQIRCQGLLGVGLCDVNFNPLRYAPQYVAEASVASYVGQMDDQFFQDASFVKLRELSATYTLPDHLLPSVQHASITVSGRELALWTRYRGPDPEVNEYPTGLLAADQAVIPPLSRFLVTLNLSF